MVVLNSLFVNAVEGKMGAPVGEGKSENLEWNRVCVSERVCIQKPELPSAYKHRERVWNRF